MTPEEFTKAMTYAGKLYTRDLDRQTVEAWYTFFYDTEYHSFISAIRRVVATSSFFPSIAEIKKALAEINNITVKGAPEAWADIIRLIHKYGYMQTAAALEEMEPFTREVLRKAGGYSEACRTDRPEIMQARFEKVYREESEKLIKISCIPEKELTAAEKEAKAISQNAGNMLVMQP